MDEPRETMEKKNNPHQQLQDAHFALHHARPSAQLLSKHRSGRLLQARAAEPRHALAGPRGARLSRRCPAHWGFAAASATLRGPRHRYSLLPT